MVTAAPGISGVPVKLAIGAADNFPVGRFCKLLLSFVAGIWAVSVALAAPIGATQTDLGTQVVSQTLPDFVETSPGLDNGPITPRSASALFGDNSELASELQQDLANGTFSGYVRIWTHQPVNGDAIVILALRLPDSGHAQAFLAGMNHGVSSVASGSFDVPSIAGASGFIGRQPLQGQPASEYSVTFGRNSTVFEVEAATVSQDLSYDDAISVANSQAAQVGGSTVPPTAPPGVSSQDPMLRVSYVLGEVVAVLAVITLVLYFIRRERRREKTTLPGPTQPPISTGSFGPPLAPQPSGLGGLPPLQTYAPSQAPPGWYPDTTDPSSLRYFDGSVWTAHRSPR
jgi:hypothetical protein